MLFNSNKSFVWIKKSLLNKLFSFIQSNLLSHYMDNFINNEEYRKNERKEVETAIKGNKCHGRIK